MQKGEDCDRKYIFLSKRLNFLHELNFLKKVSDFCFLLPINLYFKLQHNVCNKKAEL